jgi:glycosyltransferase involved in cell wall biosynthesis
MHTSIVIDGMFYQIGRSGIARVWTKLLENWAHTEFAQQLVVVDRQKTCPRVPGITYRDATAFFHNNDKADRKQLQAICDDVQATLFTSTYYTLPVHTPSAMLVHDMIPEVLGWNLQEPMWQQKQKCLQESSYFAAISRNTARDLRQHLNKLELPVCIAYDGNDFQATSPAQVADFKARHRITRPYFLISGSRSDYKNVKLFFDAFETLGTDRAYFAIVCTGGGQIEAEFVAQAGPAHLQVVILNDQDMQNAYTGALALVYPSMYEGFGLPVLEAMSCDCPVITTNAASIPEVGGDAPLYIDLNDKTRSQLLQMRECMISVIDPEVRRTKVQMGRIQARQFSWSGMADVMQNFFMVSSQAAQKRTQPLACHAI